MASPSLSTTLRPLLRRNPTPSAPIAVSIPVVCGPRGNRSKLQRGRMLSTEAILAVQALKRAAAAGDEARVNRIVSTDFSRLIKSDLLAAIAELQRQDQWRLAVKAFAAARGELWYRTDLALYAEMVSTLARCGFPGEIDALVADLLKEEGWVSSVNAKGIFRLVKALMVAERGKLVKALMVAERGKLVKDVYNELKKGGFEPDEFLFKYLIRGLRRLGEDSAADEVERDFEVWDDCGSLPGEPLPV